MLSVDCWIKNPDWVRGTSGRNIFLCFSVPLYKLWEHFNCIYCVWITFLCIKYFLWWVICFSISEVLSVMFAWLANNTWKKKKTNNPNHRIVIFNLSDTHAFCQTIVAKSTCREEMYQIPSHREIWYDVDSVVQCLTFTEPITIYTIIKMHMYFSNEDGI